MNMKKNLLVAGLLALGLGATSCSENTAVDTPQATTGAISFRTLNDYAKTRGTEVTTGTMNQTGVKFNVWAQDAGQTAFRMNGVEVEYDGATYFKSTADYFWPESGDVNFWAVYNNYVGTTTVDNTTKNITGFVPTAAHGTEPMTDLQKDLVMAYGTGNKAGNEATGMPLNFQHALSQIEFQALNNSPSYDVYIAGISIHNLDGSADVTFQAAAADKPTWTNNGNAATAAVEYHNLGSFPSAAVGTTAGAVTSGAAAGSNFMLIPQDITAYAAGTITGSFARVYIQVRDKSSGDIIYPYATNGGGPVTTSNENNVAAADVPLPAITWEAGKKYIYTLDFSNGVGNKPFTPVTPNPNPGVNPEPVVPTPSPDPTPTPTPILGQPIKFVVTVEAWADGGTHNINM